ncbi:hypothetical protein ACT6QH_00695 [Xanthobacter sp. TB0139]|uniref:hypothetical protein n=1 Tax=Xanthobacter sp. TB0139 TaxID=3459178 RepID=UPI004039D50C
MAPMVQLNVTAQPYRMMKKGEAASYCGLPLTRFERLCPVAPVVYPDGSKLWDVRDMDLWLDGLKGGDISGDDAILDRLG